MCRSLYENPPQLGALRIVHFLVVDLPLYRGEYPEQMADNSTIVPVLFLIRVLHDYCDDIYIPACLMCSRDCFTPLDYPLTSSRLLYPFNSLRHEQYFRLCNNPGCWMGIKTQWQRHDGYNLVFFPDHLSLYLDGDVSERSTSQRRQNRDPLPESKVDVLGHCMPRDCVVCCYRPIRLSTAISEAISQV